MKMAAKGQDTGDIEARQIELDHSLDDINNMRANQTIEFRYASIYSKEARLYDVENPTTQYTAKNTNGDVVITMFTEKNMGSVLHEGRHGGDIAKYILKLNNRGGYGVSHEVSAYRAQYAWNGFLQYKPADYLSNNQILGSAFDKLGQGMIPTVSVVDINSINPGLVNNIGTSVTYNKENTSNKAWMPLYPPNGIKEEIWVNH